MAKTRRIRPPRRLGAKTLADVDDGQYVELEGGVIGRVSKFEETCWLRVGGEAGEIVPVGLDAVVLRSSHAPLATEKEDGDVG